MVLFALSIVIFFFGNQCTPTTRNCVCSGGSPCFADDGWTPYNTIGFVLMMTGILFFFVFGVLGSRRLKIEAEEGTE
jgi:hypothetical protein